MVCDVVGVIVCGVVWCGVMWCGVMWCDVVWCDVVGALRLPTLPGINARFVVP